MKDLTPRTNINHYSAHFECDGSPLQQADLPCLKEETSTTTSTRKCRERRPTPLYIRVQKGRGSRCVPFSGVQRSTIRLKKGVRRRSVRGAGDRENLKKTTKEKEVTLRQTAKLKYWPETQSLEPAAQEAPNASSGHA
ncbi:hypothetical protein NDU88_002250 [Pleurodeles waltl]|uniref:Uncharacterized protein n=1 Tax=Pleurodeles waltl TaxID=8319 RepID=A0AAV7T1P5_PLEWA|nr:hypothetical protein NDU88_002250 [Pleurodeles waltl]